MDDEPDIELLINQRFRRQVRAGEFAFCFAHNGEKALNRLQADASIDLIMLDINMPVMEGLTMLTDTSLRLWPVVTIDISRLKRPCPSIINLSGWSAGLCS